MAAHPSAGSWPSVPATPPTRVPSFAPSRTACSWPIHDRPRHRGSRPPRRQGGTRIDALDVSRVAHGGRAKRKAHDAWLTGCLGRGKRSASAHGRELLCAYPWGEAWSSFDPKGGFSAIDVRFLQGRAAVASARDSLATAPHPQTETPPSTGAQSTRNGAHSGDCVHSGK